MGRNRFIAPLGGADGADGAIKRLRPTRRDIVGGTWPMPAPFAILGIDHVVLRATDPAALERFYLEVLGCTLEKRQGTLTQLRAGSALIDIVPADEPGPAGGSSRSGGANLDHLCLRVEPFDAAAIARHLPDH